MKNINDLLNPPSPRYYYYNGQKIFLPIVRDELLVSFKDALEEEKKFSLLSSIDNGQKVFL